MTEPFPLCVECPALSLAGKGAPGGLFHWVTKTDDGLRIVDVWESKEVFEQFAQEKIGPSMAQVGYTEQPEITFAEVHNHLYGG